MSKKYGTRVFIGGKMNEAEKKELKGIEYIRQTNNLNDIKTVLALYNKLMEKEIFQTSVGIEFMEGLRKSLIDSKEIQNHDIYGYQTEQPKEEKNTKENKYKYKYYNSLIINIILFVALLIGFYITTNSKNINILNYENKLLDKYSAWEAELKERESIVAEKEKALK